jgi:succinate-semialdehyde dehydrogenase/glutarate-semialdehyde dehydrogenase
MMDQCSFSSRELELLQSAPNSLFIGGTWQAALDGKRFAVLDPSNKQCLVQVSDAGEADATRTLDLAWNAFSGWAKTAPRARAELLRKCYEAIIAESDNFALLITLEMGKPLAEARAEVAYGAEFFRWFAEEAVRLGGRYAQAPSGNGQFIVRNEAVGPVYAITPWNFPLAMGARKIAPALAAGCTVILKPAEETPLTALLLAKIMHACGVPAGVVNVLPTSDPSAMTAVLTADARLRKITFTGSTAVGRVLVRASAGRLLRTSMELGGNAPFLVFEDCDLDAAVEGALSAKMRNMGEACTAANRFYVHRSVAQLFTNKMAERLSKYRLGRGTEPDVQVGPLISEKQRKITDTLVQDALAKGARIVMTSELVPEDGYFYPVTVLDQIPGDARLLREEIFGPVTAIVPFDTEEEALRMANDAEHGLASYVYTTNLERAWRVANALEFGMVGLNRGIISDPAAPFGGVKASGFGREGGVEGIHEYLQQKYVAFP